MGARCACQSVELKPLAPFRHLVRFRVRIRVRARVGGLG